MMSSEPLVSIIMPAFNAEAYIRTAVESVLAQTYEHWELLVVDDGSTDGTARIVEDFRDSRIVLIRKTNGGVSSARNVGLNNAKGSFIAFLDSDDIWLSQKLAQQVSFMLERPETAISHTLYASINEAGKPILNRQLYPFQIVDAKERLLVFNYIATLTVMLRADIISAIDGFDESLMGPEDWDCWLRVCNLGELGLIELDLARYREHSGGISKRVDRQLANEYRVLERHVFSSARDDLKKKALWFFLIKRASANFRMGRYVLFIVDYIRSVSLFPFKPENVTYVFSRVVRFFQG